jgi:hypothetical protein
LRFTEKCPHGGLEERPGHQGSRDGFSPGDLHGGQEAITSKEA